MILGGFPDQIMRHVMILMILIIIIALFDDLFLRIRT